MGHVETNDVGLNKSFSILSMNIQGSNYLSALSYTEDHNICLVWEVVVEVKLHLGGFCFVWDLKAAAAEAQSLMISSHGTSLK